MANTIRIKRRAQGGGAGAPASLANAELAFNEHTDVLYIGEGTGGEGGTATQALAIGGSGAFVDLSSTQSIGGTKTVTGTLIVPAPTADDHAANKGYVDAVARGLDWKPSVRVATGSNITLSGEQTIDGKAVVAGDRVLVKAQTTQSQNGIYVAAAGSWTRATDFSATGGPGGASSATAGATVFVSEGTTYGNTSWTCTTDDPITVGTTDVVFAQIAGSGSEATAANVGNSGTGVYYGASGNELQFRKIAAGDGVSVTTASPDNGTLTVAVGSDVVRTTGAQSIGGTKTFTSRLDILDADQYELGALQIGGIGPTDTYLGTSFIPAAGPHGVRVKGDILGYGNLVLWGAGKNIVVQDGIVSVAKDPTSNNHVTRKSWVDTQLAGKQNADATLTALSGVTVAADQVIYSTGADAFSTTGLTAAGRALLDDADAAAQRTTLGLGSAATLASTAVVQTTGEQSIAGEKTFTDALRVQAAQGVLVGNPNVSIGHQSVVMFGGQDGITVVGNSVMYGNITMWGKGKYIYLPDSDLKLGKDPTANDHATRKSWVDTQLAGKQDADADLAAIAALSGTSGLLRKTAASTWSLDTATYLTDSSTIDGGTF